jgi:hypothetical protein
MAGMIDEPLRRDYLLAAAFLHTRPQVPPVTASSFRVLRHALVAAGLWDDKLQKNHSLGFHGEFDQCPVIGEWYASLIALTRHTPIEERLLQGAGNLDPEAPAGPYFTACWLTPAGMEYAERLLQEHPDWPARLSATA